MTVIFQFSYFHKRVHNINKMCKKPHFLGLEKDYSIGYFKYVWNILVVVQWDHLIVPCRLCKRLCWQLYSILSCKLRFISTTTTVYKWQKVPCPIFPLRSFTFTLLALQWLFFFSSQVFGFQAGLTCQDNTGEFLPLIPIIPSFSTALYGKLIQMPSYW